VAPILLIFLRISEGAGQLLVGPNGLWPTQRKFWACPPRRHCSGSHGLCKSSCQFGLSCFSVKSVYIYMLSTHFASSSEDDLHYTLFFWVCLMSSKMLFATDIPFTSYFTFYHHYTVSFCFFVVSCQFYCSPCHRLSGILLVNVDVIHRSLFLGRKWCQWHCIGLLLKYLLILYNSGG